MVIFMSRPKKGADGFYRRNFSYDGKKYSVRAKNPKDLAKKMAEKIKALQNDTPVLQPEMKVSEWADQWLITYNSNLRTASYERTRGILANHICKHIGHMKLNTVRPLSLQKILNTLADEGKSKDTIKHVQQTMKRMFDSAKENRLVSDNPAANLTIPRCEAAGSHRSLTSRERDILLRTAQWHRAGPWVCLLLYTGLRPGESAALNRSDIADGFVHVSKALDSRTNEIKPPKSRAGIRAVPIPAPLARMIEDQGKTFPGLPLLTQFDRTKERRPTEKRHTKQSLKNLWADFSAAMNQTEADMIARGLIPALREQLPPITPYDLRHTYCTDLARAGVPLVTASKLMGHSNVSITAKIYTHVDQEMAATAVSKLNDFYGESTDDIVTTRKPVKTG